MYSYSVSEIKFSWWFWSLHLFNYLSWFNQSRAQLTYVQNTSHDLSAPVPRTDKRLILSYFSKKKCKILVVIFRFSIQLVFKRVNTNLASLEWFMRYLPIHFNIILRKSSLWAKHIWSVYLCLFQKRALIHQLLCVIFLCILFVCFCIANTFDELNGFICDFSLFLKWFVYNFVN